jgi:trehalose-phosphatase
MPRYDAWRRRSTRHENSRGARPPSPPQAIANYVTSPRHLLDVWPDVAPRLAQADRVALFLDFDGTLVRLRRRPSDARMGAETHALLEQLARTPVLTGVITGRGLPDVRARVGVKGIWYAGDHGYCLVAPDNHRINLANPTERARIARTRRRLSRALAAQPSVVFDVKAASLAVHYRGAPAGSCRIAEQAVRSALAAEPGLSMLRGKKVWEILPGNRVDKWTAVQLILRRSGRKPRTVIFAGDDVTDERVFERMRGISVFVGIGRATAARFWLRSPGEVRQFLKQCLQLWK